MAQSWNEVVARPDFTTLPVEEKTKLRDAYYSSVVEPLVPQQDRETARQSFIERTNPTFMRPMEAAGGGRNESDFPSFAWDRIKQGFSQGAGFAASVLNFDPQGPETPPAQRYENRLAQHLGVKDLPPTTFAQKATKVPLEFLGMSATGPSELAIASSPNKWRAIATEAGSIFGGGEGQEIGETVGKTIDNKPDGSKGGWETALGLTGGILGGGGLDSMLGPNLLVRGATGGKNWVREQYEKVVGHTVTEDEIKQVVGPKLYEYLNSHEEAGKNLAESEVLKSKIPGYKPDLAQATQSPAIVSLKENFARKSLDAVRRFEEISNNNKAAIAAFEKESFPSATVLPHQVASQKVQHTDQQYQQHIETLDKQITDTQNAIQELSNEFPSVGSKMAEGSRLNQLSTELGKMVKEKSKAQYALLYDEADKFAITVDAEPVEQFVRNVLTSRKDYFAKKPPSFYMIMDYAKRYLKSELPKDATKASLPKYQESLAQYPLQNAIKSFGGLSKKELRDISSDVATGRNGSRGVLGGAFSDTGKGLDDLVVLLKKKGYHITGDSKNDEVAKLRQMIRDEIMGTPQRAEADMEAEFLRMSHERNIAVDEASKKNISFQEAHELKKRISADFQKTSKDNYQERELLEQLKKLIDNQFSKIEQVPGFGQKLKAAEQYWQKFYQEPYNEGAGGAMKARANLGEKVAREKIHSDLFLSKGEKGASDFIRQFGDNPEAMEINRKMTLAEFVEQSQSDGKFNLKKARAFAKNHKAYLDQFDDIKQSINDVIGFGAYKEEEGGRLVEELRQVQDMKKQAASSELAKISKEENTQFVVGKALNDPAYARELINAVHGNQLAEEGLASEVARHILMKENPAEFLSDPNLSNSTRALLANLGSKHWDNLVTIAKAEKAVKFGGKPAYQVKDAIPDPMEEVLGTSTKGLFSRLRGNVMGYTSPGYVAFDIGGKFVFKMKKEAADKFMEQVITDPETAAELAKLYSTRESQVDAAKRVLGTASERSKSKVDEILHELVPHLRMHGIRVTAYNLTEPDDTEKRKKEKTDLNTQIRSGLRSVGATQ